MIGKSGMESEIEKFSVGCLGGEEGTEREYKEENRSKIGMKRKG